MIEIALIVCILFPELSLRLELACRSRRRSERIGTGGAPP